MIFTIPFYKWSPKSCFFSFVFYETQKFSSKQFTGVPLRIPFSLEGNPLNPCPPPSLSLSLFSSLPPPLFYPPTLTVPQFWGQFASSLGINRINHRGSHRTDEGLNLLQGSHKIIYHTLFLCFLLLFEYGAYQALWVHGYSVHLHHVFGCTL